MTSARQALVPSVYLFLVREGLHGPEVLLQLRRPGPMLPLR